MFRFRAFLVVLTLSATYGVISAIRVFKIKETGPRLLDNTLSAVFCSIAIGMIIFTPIPPQESAIIFKTTLVTLITICFYDLMRNINGAAWLQRSWLNEHIYKMIGSHSALISAAAGNMFIELQPWSIVIPTSIGMLLVIFFVVRNPLPRKMQA